VREVLKRAGFLDVSVEASSPDFDLGLDLDVAATNAVEVGPVSRLLLEVDGATRGRVLAAIREALKPYVSTRGVVLPAKTWIVRGRT
jgi:hypothetical protein